MRAALAVLALLLLPTNAAAASRTATLGQVSATITWTTGGGLARDLHVSIARAGATLVDQPVAPDDGGPGVGPWARGVRVADLDGDGEPEVLVDAYTGGAHCCEVTTLWWFDGAGYQAVRHDWGNSTYRLGGGLLVGSDDAFDYAFTAYAFSRPPVEILGPRLQDITAQHPHLVRRDARRQLHVWSRYRDRAAP